MIASLGQFVKKHAQVVIWIVVGIVALGALVAGEYHGRSSLSFIVLCLSVYRSSGGMGKAWWSPLPPGSATLGLVVLSRTRGETDREEFGGHFGSICPMTRVLSIYKWRNYYPLFRARVNKNGRLE